MCLDKGLSYGNSGCADPNEKIIPAIKVEAIFGKQIELKFVPFNEAMIAIDNCEHLAEIAELRQRFMFHQKKYTKIQLNFAEEHFTEKTGELFTNEVYNPFMTFAATIQDLIDAIKRANDEE